MKEKSTATRSQHFTDTCWQLGLLKSNSKTPRSAHDLHVHHDLVPRDFPSHFLRISPGDEAFWFISSSFSTLPGDLNEQVFLSKEIMLVFSCGRR